MIPPSLDNAVLDALRTAGDSSALRHLQPVTGGCTNEAVRVGTDDRFYFLKWNAQALPGLFTSEAHGLDLLRRHAGVRVPAVLAVQDATESVPGFILLEWIEAQPAAYQRMGGRFGEKLAAFHRAGAHAAPNVYGLDADNYIGCQPQPNGWDQDWVCFYRERRLRPQLELGKQTGRLPASRRRRLEKLMDRLDEWLGGVERQPVLLHGDLWKGNVMFDGAGRLAFVDPAVVWGDREFDLATVEVYDPAPDGFFDAYRAVWPTPPGRALRRDLYHLYLLLSCLNMGADYGSRVDAALKRYVG